jgi:uncharacterized protein (TIGR03437 family)
VKRLAAICCAVAALLSVATPASGYYHFLHFRQTDSGLRGVPERFDREALVDDTVYFYVSSQQRPRLQANDSFEGLVSQVRQALATWDAVPTSSLRVGFGGVLDGPLEGSTPAAEIVFDELPPGVLGFGGSKVRGEAREDFVPILRSQVVVSDNLADNQGPSFSERFYNTLVHEIGHALGLQHSLAGSALSQEPTRSTTRARPLELDDVAGLSALYPTEEFRELTGAIEGIVLFDDGPPVSLASVAALNRGGQIVSALTDPQGRYRIEGLLPGEYTLYAQPLPPATTAVLGPGNIRRPVDANGQEIAASGGFRTEFLGETDRVDAARFVAVGAGAATGGADFRVQRRARVALLPVTTFSFPGYGAPGVHPAFLNVTEGPGLLVAAGADLLDKFGAFQLSAIFRDLTVRAPTLYEPAPSFVRFDVEPAPFAGLGALHLMFRLQDDIYVLPGAARLTNQGAPIIYWITRDFSQGVPAWRIAGQEFGPGSQVYFDGLPGRVLAFDSVTGELLAAPPVGPAGHRAVVTVYNSDGQSSAFALPDGNVMFAYPEGPGASASASNNVAAPGTDRVIEITGLFTQFAPGDAVVGVGSSDIVTREVQVLDDQHIRAVVSLGATAQRGLYDLSVSTGLETILLPDAFEVKGDAGADDRPILRYNGLLNSATNTNQLAPGTLASLYGLHLTSADAESAVRVTFNGLEAPLVAVSENQINVQIPSAVQPGLAELRVFNGAADSELMLVAIGRSAPGLFGVVSGKGVIASAGSPLEAGQIFKVIATGFGVSPVSLQEAVVLVNGIRLRPISATAPSPGIQELTVTLPAALGSIGAARIEVLVAGRLSNALEVPVAAGLVALQ